jgi:hypothetical protein
MAFLSYNSQRRLQRGHPYIVVVWLALERQMVAPVGRVAVVIEPGATDHVLCCGQRGVYQGEDILVIPTQTSKVFSLALDSTSALSAEALSAYAPFLSPTEDPPTAGSGAFLLAVPGLSRGAALLDFSPDISMSFRRDC